MRPRSRNYPLMCLLAAVLAIVALLASGRRLAGQPLARAVSRKEVWLTPNAGSLDMQKLFEAPAEWPTALTRLSVFKFYQGQALEPPPNPGTLPNDYGSLRSVLAFSRLTRLWNKRIALEVGVVKPFYCSPDGSAERRAVADTIAAIWNVEAAGGHVDYLAMDEPFISGVTTAACGAPDPAPTADRIVRYIQAIKRAYPRAAVGLIEAYPYFSAARLVQFLDLMRSRGVVFPFFHLDVDVENMNAAARASAPGDLRYLAGFAAALGTRFGMIFWGQNGDSSAAFANGVILHLQLAERAFGDWTDMPDDLIFQSWARSSSGQGIIPPNLPETAPDTLTNLVVSGLGFLEGPAAARFSRRSR